MAPGALLRHLRHLAIALRPFHQRGTALSSPQPTLEAERLRDLLLPYASPDMLQPPLIAHLSTYLDLLLRWNAKTNLSAIREPSQIVERHFGESLFAATYLAQPATLLDFGSGAGFPGIPMQLVHPGCEVSLAESQGKKAAFLSEVIRTLGLPTRVWRQRVEALPQGTRFSVVTMRAVDHIGPAVRVASRLASRLCLLTSKEHQHVMSYAPAFHFETFAVPNSIQRVLLVGNVQG